MIVRCDGKEINVSKHRYFINCECGVVILVTDEGNAGEREFSQKCEECGKVNSFKYSINKLGFAFYDHDFDKPKDKVVGKTSRNQLKLQQKKIQRSMLDEEIERMEEEILAN